MGVGPGVGLGVEVGVGAAGCATLDGGDSTGWFAFAPTALAALIRPEAKKVPVPLILSAEDCRMSRTWAGLVAPFAQTSAARPATWGAAMLVPLSDP